MRFRVLEGLYAMKIDEMILVMIIWYFEEDIQGPTGKGIESDEKLKDSCKARMTCDIITKTLQNKSTFFSLTY